MTLAFRVITLVTSIAIGFGIYRAFSTLFGTAQGMTPDPDGA